MSQITEPVAQLLKGKNFAYLSTLMKDGSPQVTPTWVDIDKDGNSILINTAEGRIKHKNLSRSKSGYFCILRYGQVSLSFTKRKESHSKDKARKSLLSTTA
jgi:predicted pyridoxine 5'-phosphate oxidase superfamily flavin-nucleotide-binding protein